jgi:L-amino acid N-acyltransferase YncA
MPSSRKGEKLTWEQHNQWFQHRDTHLRKDWIILFSDQDAKDSGAFYRPVGVIHRDARKSIEDMPEVGLYIGDISLWGSGIGSTALEEVIQKTREERYPGLFAMIHSKNKRSIQLFTNAGFVKTKEKGRKGQNVYKYRFSATV